MPWQSGRLPIGDHIQTCFHCALVKDKYDMLLLLGLGSALAVNNVQVASYCIMHLLCILLVICLGPFSPTIKCNRMYTLVAVRGTLLANIMECLTVSCVSY